MAYIYEKTFEIVWGPRDSFPCSTLYMCSSLTLHWCCWTFTFAVPQNSLLWGTAEFVHLSRHKWERDTDPIPTKLHVIWNLTLEGKENTNKEILYPFGYPKNQGFYVRFSNWSKELFCCCFLGKKCWYTETTHSPVTCNFIQYFVKSKCWLSSYFNQYLTIKSFFSV